MQQPAGKVFHIGLQANMLQIPFKGSMTYGSTPFEGSIS